MEVSEKTRIMRLMRRFSGVEELFGWYGIETEDIGAQDTVQELAWQFRADVDDLIADLQAIVDDESSVQERDPDDDEEDDDDDEDGFVDDEDPEEDGASSDDWDDVDDDEDDEDEDEDDMF
jgi:hypothetical protein